MPDIAKIPIPSFTRKEDARAAFYNSNMQALKAAQAAFAGAAEEAGLESEEDVVAMIKEMRREILTPSEFVERHAG